MRRPSFSFLSLALGGGGALFVGAMHLYDYILRAQTEELPRQAKLDQLWWVAVVLSALGLVLAVPAIFSGREPRRRAVGSAVPALAVFLNCVVPAYLHRMPSIAEEELAEVRDRAMPLIEEVAGLRFKDIPQVELGSFQEHLEQVSLERALSGDEELPILVILGRYRQESGRIAVLPDALDLARRKGGWYAGETRELAHLTVIHELVHALDHQHGRLRSEAELGELLKTDATAFFVQRALEEGHARWVAGEVGTRMELESPREIRRGIQTEESRRNSLEGSIYSEALNLVYGEGSRFMQTLYERGGPELVATAFRRPPVWKYHLSRPETYLEDLESGERELHLHVIESIGEYFPAKRWHPAGPGPMLMDLPAGGRHELVGLLSGSFYFRPEDSPVMSGTFALIRLWRFGTPDGARRFLDGECERLREEGKEFDEVSERRLKGEGVDGTYRFDAAFLEAPEEPPVHRVDYLGHRGRYVAGLSINGLEKGEEVGHLWDSLVAYTLDVLERKPE